MKRKIDGLAQRENLAGIDEELQVFQALLENEMEAKLQEGILLEEQTRRRLSMMEDETFRLVREEWTDKENILSRREAEIREEVDSFTEKLKGFLAVSGDLENLLENTWTDLTNGILS